MLKPKFTEARHFEPVSLRGLKIEESKGEKSTADY